MSLNLDSDGYLAKLEDWTPSVAETLANKEGVKLTEAHWEVIHALRAFYQVYAISPSQRPFVKHIANTLGKDKGSSLYLMTLFPESPAKVAAKIAGLPRPTNCF